MQRRGFLGLIGGAALAPALPSLPAAQMARTAARRSGYQGLLYGMAKFHAQTGGVAHAAELMPKLGVNAAKAQALMAQLVVRGIVSPVAMAGVQAPSKSSVPLREIAQRAGAVVDRLADEGADDEGVGPVTGAETQP